MKILNLQLNLPSAGMLVFVILLLKCLFYFLHVNYKGELQTLKCKLCFLVSTE